MVVKEVLASRVTPIDDLHDAGRFVVLQKGIKVSIIVKFSCDDGAFGEVAHVVDAVLPAFLVLGHAQGQNLTGATKPLHLLTLASGRDHYGSLVYPRVIDVHFLVLRKSAHELAVMVPLESKGM